MFIIHDCERFGIRLFLVRSKSNIHTRNVSRDLRRNENGDVAEGRSEKYQEKARQYLVDKNMQDLEAEAGLAMLYAIFS